ncbi:diguanylate phosphodiesterase [Methylovorus sp. MM2]|uniref:EAL and HDOD domain-containing protein n=1 Tax=Methylovorus sp. MM2 TaxID=1848038 RepID=UPI0007E1A417|nr:EAL domain-containing protein [Methylovorus sp. MM2]OAM52138.1 diguanylate phosphodiesterase [Methylovorus sp. MM2]
MSEAVLESFTSEIFLGRQPILSPEKKIVAYELLFRSEDSIGVDVVDDIHATSTVIVNMLSQFGVEHVLGNNDAFINVSASLLMSETIELLPHDRVILEILEDVPISTQLITRCEELKDMGFRLSLDDFIYRTEYDPILPLIDIVKIDLTLTPLDTLPQVIAQLRQRTNALLLAEKVEAESEFQRCAELGFSLFQGYFFAHPVILQGKKPQPSQMTLMRIMGMLIGDANVNELEKPFKESPNLTVSLLRLVNSVGISGGRQQIGSLRQAIVVLGQKQLLRWVQLLLYVSPEGNVANTLMQQVANRARLMELIALQLNNDRTFGDQAFMVGMLSLIEALLQVPLADILKQIGLVEAVEQAILTKSGTLGKLLELAELMELNDFKAATTHIHALGLSVHDFTAIQLQAIQWANELNKEVA